VEYLNKNLRRCEMKDAIEIVGGILLLLGTALLISLLIPAGKSPTLSKPSLSSADNSTSNNKGINLNTTCIDVMGITFCKTTNE
jgi:hypothetical protein